MLTFLRKNWLVLLVATLAIACSSPDKPRVLVFSKTTVFRHESIADGIAAIRKLGTEHNFEVDTTENAANINEENLAQYSAVIFLNTTGDVLNPEQQNDFERYIQAGGGFVGIHAATDTEYNWPWYGKLVGAWFDGHPSNPNVRKGIFHVVDRKHEATDSLPDPWKVEDEFYNFKSINPDIKVLLKVDEKSYGDGKNGENHPMAWYHEFDGGRVFYTNLGHQPALWTTPLFVKHLWGGIHYAISGPAKRDYSKSHTLRVPNENRFTKVVLDEKLDEPMELVMLPGNKVLFVERKGAVKLFDPAVGKTKTIATIPVSTKYQSKEGKISEAEDGLLGVTRDPHFDTNHWIYFYYSPAGTASVNTLVRYELQNDQLVESSKKVILEVNTQREQCCHTGGSLAFDGNGNLFLSTGDNTSPRSTAYSPSDERPGRSPWDAQKSSANTNDLRGKVLRIHPEDNGTYTIPEGNLFPKGTAGTRPEIYVMGTRNPFRISVDKKTGFLYWGDVGPDAGKDSVGRGPKAMDEFNQARKPGYFGWPYFVGDNKPYNKYDFKTGKSGPLFDPAKPENTSPNNTGLKELPPSQKAFIWYPYDASPEFPLVGTGGRTAMAGQVFYASDFKNAKRAFPDYYDGKLFIYEWMRGWIMTVTMDKDGNYVSMEPFMPSHRFSNPMDMEFGDDGDLYMLEYGTAWFQGNDDARLVKIEYNGGNRKPLVRTTVDHAKGAVPLTASFSSEGTADPDRDDIKYEWKFMGSDSSVIKTVSEPSPVYTFDKAGTYIARLTVTDSKGEKTVSDLTILAGNAPPELTLTITKGNHTFFFPDQAFDYEVNVTDAEDGTLADGKITQDQVVVKADYLKDGLDAKVVAQGHLDAGSSLEFASGKKLMAGSDCKSCHLPDKKSIGPAYQQIAERYKKDKDAANKLAAKVVSGGGGVWGETAMAAHPQLSTAEATDIVKYILSMAPEAGSGRGLATKGSYKVEIPKGEGNEGVLAMSASYTDKGANGIPPASSEKLLVLRSPNLAAGKSDVTDGVQKFKLPEPPIELVIAMKDGGNIGYHSWDLTGLTQVDFVVFAPEDQLHAAGGKIEVRIDSPTGQLVGETPFITPTKGPVTAPIPSVVSAHLSPVKGDHDVYFVFRNKDAVSGQGLFILLNVKIVSKPHP